MLDPDMVLRLVNAKSLFVKGDYYEEFLEKFSDSVKARYLAVGNSDRDFTDVELPGSVELAYFQNLLTPVSYRVKLLPIGVENLSLARSCIPLYLVKPIPFLEKRNLFLNGPFSPTHTDRMSLKNLDISKFPNSHSVAEYLNPFRYIRIANDFKFIAAPRGNGEDTHRFWEALYLNSVPVIRNSVWAKNVQSMGIPCVVVDSWKEDLVRDAIAEFLADQKDLTFPASMSLDYWREIFNG
jgi:hypothetical protein